MVRIYECSFCGHEIEPGTGTMVVTRDNVLRFDSRKCKRSHDMKRDPRKLKWTTKYENKIVTEETLAKAKAKSKAKVDTKAKAKVSKSSKKTTKKASKSKKE